MAEIVGGRIYFARPAQLNDLFEGSPLWMPDAKTADVEAYVHRRSKVHLAGVRGSQRAKAKAAARKRIQSPEFWTTQWEDQGSEDGIYCLSERADHPLMWAHYADAHRGYCLQFTIHQEDWRVFELPLEVHYSEERPVLRTSEFLQFIPRDGERPPKDFLIRAFLTKHVDWAYEREWRMVRASISEASRLASYPPHLLTGIVLGARMDPPGEERLREWVRARGRTVTWYRTRPSLGFGLSIEPLDR